MNTHEELYQTCSRVYFGTRELPIKNQRGKQYVNFKGKQINLKDIPEKKIETDEVFDYIFNYGHTNRCERLEKLSKQLIYNS